MVKMKRKERDPFEIDLSLPEIELSDFYSPPKKRRRKKKDNHWNLF